MKKILPILLMMLVFQLVLAAELDFYPNEKAFESFLDNGRSYHVLPGESEYSKAWAKYLDEKLSRFKEKGEDTIVLVGNVYENPKMMEFWHLTGLPYEASLKPSVIVLDNVVFFTGSEENIYLIERAFSQKHAFRTQEVYGSLLIGILLVILFTFIFSKNGAYTHFFYILTVALIVLWFSNSNLFTIDEGFVRSTFQDALLGKGGTPLTLVLDLYFNTYSPSEEALFILHLFLVFLIATLSFFIVPKSYRELGFVVFGLTFASPTFRHSLENFNECLFEVFVLVIVLGIILNAMFTEETTKSIKRIAVLSFITTFGALIWPYFVLIPFFMFLAFPTKSMRNYLYLGLTVIGLLVGNLYFKIPFPKWPLDANFNYLMLFVKEDFIQLILIIYAVFNFKTLVMRMKGGKALLFWLFLSLLVLLPVIPEIFPALILVSSGLVIRLILLFQTSSLGGEGSLQGL
ncbi:hypothetical protein DRN38_04440 [Thermococci archaeon]|nr:MAG: hypothetical protein DRN38_04440 [Thermococci archaeon]